MRRLATFLLAFCVLGVFAAPTSLARADELPPLVIVFDVSGSMNDKDATDTVKLSTAKRSISELVRAQPPRTPMGVWTYPGGTTVGGCAAGSWVNQLAPDNHPDATDVDAQVRALSANGNTPTGPALTAVTQSLQQKGYRGATIVLVSDGESNCGPPPCEVAKSVVDAGFDLTVAAVAFDIQSGKNEELQCIADVTGGTFTQAGNSDELIDELSKYEAKDLELAVDGPSKVQAGAHATFTVKVTNPSTTNVLGASLLISFDDRSLVSYLPSPQYRLPVIPAGGSVSRTWVVGTDSRYEGTTGWRVLAGSRDAGSVLTSGELEVSQTHLSRSDGGDILAPRNGVVVAMGDSYSSGEGIGTYLDDVPACHRSDRVYGAHLSVIPSETELIACSGAVSRQLTRERQHPSTPPQITQLKQLRKQGITVDMVVLTIGGNDIGFAGVVEACFLGTCAPDERAYLRSVAGRGSYEDLYVAIAKEINTDKDVKARNGALAPVVVSPYPDPFWNPSRGRCNGVQPGWDIAAVPEILIAKRLAVTDLGFSRAEIGVGKRLLRELNSQVETGVQKAHQAGYPVFYADPVAEMATGHSICEEDSYFVRLTPSNAVAKNWSGLGAELFHPKASGHQAWADAIITWSQRTTFDASATVPEPSGPPQWLIDLIDRFRAPARPSSTSIDVQPSPAQTDGSFPQQASYTVTSEGTINIRMEGMRPGSTVTVVVRSEPQTLAAVVADEAGVVEATVTLPALASGKHTLTLSGHDPDHRFVGSEIPLTVHAGIPIGVIVLLGIAVVRGIVLLTTWLRYRRASRTP